MLSKSTTASERKKKLVDIYPFTSWSLMWCEHLVDEEYSICLLLSVLFWLKNISYLFTWNTPGERERPKETEWEKDRKRRQCHQIIYIFFKTFFNHKLISEREACPETSRLSVRIYRKFASSRLQTIEHHILDQAQEGGGALRQRPQNPAKWLVGVNTEADDWLASGQVAQQLVFFYPQRCWKRTVWLTRSTCWTRDS